MNVDDDAPIVSTRSGAVRGATGDGCAVFRGIPYAAAPVGPLRWRAPQPAPTWSGVRDATARGPACPQPGSGPLDGLVPGMAVGPQDEDCLTLDLWTPTLPTPGPAEATRNGLRPVLVWIHGGAFTMGSKSLGVHDGARLASTNDVIVVTLNYRLGALGFLAPDHPDATPNVGLLDQVEALRWVRSNIGAFGGDPDRVTVFGESAGGGSVLSLLSMPSARGLFHRAIVQSGATDLLLTAAGAREVTAEFCAQLGVDSHDLPALRNLPVADLLGAQARTAANLFSTVGTMPFHPAVDGEILPTSWLDAVREGSGAVPLLIGTTRDEMSLFSSFDPAAADLDRTALERRLTRARVGVDAVLAAYAGIGVTGPPEVWSRFTTDTAMWVPALRIAEANAAHAPTFMYRFDWTCSVPGLGAPHGIDIPFPFLTIDRDGWDRFVSDPDAAIGLARTIAGAWSSFARDGVPDLDHRPWPPYESTRRATAVLGRTVEIIDDPDGPIRRVLTADPSRGST